MSTKATTERLTAYAGVREIIAEKGIKCTFKLAKAQGYNGIELLYIDKECEGLSSLYQEISEAMKESEIKVECISCFTDVVTKVAPYTVVNASLDAVKECIDLAAKIGCPYVHHTLVTRLTGDKRDYDAIFPSAISAASEIAEYAKYRGITVLYEPQGMLFNGFDGYSRLMDTMLKNHVNVGMCLDIANTLWVDEECYALAEKYAALIKHVHVKDYVLDSEDKTYRTMGGRAIKEVALGKGIIDLGRVFDILTRTGYNGYISVEDNSGADFAMTAKNSISVIGSLA